MIAKGSVVIDERIFPIVDVYLDKRKFFIVAQILGPIPEIYADTYRVLDRSGAEVFRGSERPGQIHTGPMASGEYAVVTLEITVQGGVVMPTEVAP